MTGLYRAYGPEKKFGEDKLRLIQAAAAICEEYEQKGFVLTLRQLYYQFVAKDLIPNNSREYDKLGDAVSDGRRAGMISWTALEDRTRGLRGIYHQKSPAQAVHAIRQGYTLDKWKTQPCRPEIWIEKDALIGIIEPVCRELEIDYFGCRGYNSDSEAWRAGQRFAHYYQAGQRPIVFHLGDHDPSGVHMTVDNRTRLEMFAGSPVQVVRLALNMPQIEELRPPPNPAKLSDSRAASYVEEYGESSWELDALSPEYVDRLIRDAVLRVRDSELWQDALTEESEHLETLDLMIENMGGDG